MPEEPMASKAMIGFAGMTHLGLNSAAAAAERGFKVVGFDSDPGLCAALQDGRAPVMEPGLPEMLSRNAETLRFDSDPAVLADCEVVYVAPDVPTDETGESNLDPVTELIGIADAAMSPEACLVVLSQVPPGFMRTLGLERRHIYYQVETLVFGQAIRRALEPERTIVGCAEPAMPLPAPYRAFLEAYDCPILAMRYESAELAKISINCCLVASVTVANTLAELCENIGADWSEIAPALKLDRRIGPYAYLKPGLGIAGGNLERDLATVRHLAEKNGTDAGVVDAWVANSRHRRSWAFRTLERELPGLQGKPCIGVLGLAYKEDTHSTKNSPAFALIEKLGACDLRVFDPVVPAAAAPHTAAQGTATALEACQGADALAIMTPWPDFTQLDPQEIARAMRGDLLIDPYNVLDGKDCAAAGLRTFTLGRARNQTC